MSEYGVRAELLKNIRRVVVKTGTSVLTDSKGLLSHQSVERIVADVADVIGEGKEVILVSSGSIAAGIREMELARRPQKMARIQAVAAVGQCVLMQEYFKAFKKIGLTCAQVLLTNDDLQDRGRHLNIRNTLNALLDSGVVPVVNENDTVSTEEIRFGDNDRLSALLTQLMGADLLVILSDVEGLLKTESDGSKVRVSLVESDDQLAESYVWKGPSHLGTGGMKSKLIAARMLARVGDAMVIANGHSKGMLSDVLKGANVGTIFLPKTGKMAGRKRWIGYFVAPRGKVVVDEGARKALQDGKKSLLARGIQKVLGDFRPGDTVGICDPNEMEFGRGIVGYSSTDLEKVAGKKTEQIAAILGKKTPVEVIHRDNLVIL
jgi:glutamate 5-kinase